MRRLGLVISLIATAAAWPLPVRAQQPANPVIGVLSTASPSARDTVQFAAFFSGLKEGGYVEGQNLTIEYRWASEDYAQLPALAKELVDRKVSVIVTAGGHVSALAAHQATKTVPIVFTTVTDPVKDGLVASLNKPGGNVTGTAGLTSELDPKRLELLNEVKASARLIGVLVNPKRPGLQGQMRELRAAADAMKLKLEVQEAASAQDLDNAFEALARLRVEALAVTADPFFNNSREQVVAHAAKLKVPGVYQWREFVQAGGLMSYGPSITDAYRQAGVYAARILKGAKPADLPVMQPSKFDLVINAKTATALGLTLSRTLRARADEIIE
jgi:putative ABC transport system substrate-binding protein